MAKIILPLTDTVEQRKIKEKPYNNPFPFKHKLRSLPFIAWRYTADGYVWTFVIVKPLPPSGKVLLSANIIALIVVNE